MNTVLSLLSDLLMDLPVTIRAQRLVQQVRERFFCDAVGLLQIDGEALVPLAFVGLSREAMGRRFVIEQHPRLAAVMASSDPVRFVPGDPRPDPYDGLVAEYLGQPLPVHDCLGIRLSLDGAPCGVMTLDALEGRTFTEKDMASLQTFARLAQIMLRMSQLEQDSRSFRLLRAKHTASNTLQTGTERPVLIGQSPVMETLLQELELVSDSDLPLLLVGEAGTGKKQLVQWIHSESRRADNPLVHVNCVVLSDALAEMELFGTPETAQEPAYAGCLERAQGGTLFLEEICGLPLTTQSKLLWLLQTGHYSRLGETQQRAADVRLLVSSQRDLAQAVRDGQLLPDLYDRLIAYPLRVPPLRDRGSDVLLLAGRFLELNRARHGLQSLRLSEQAQRALAAYSWPGNIKELKHVLDRAAIRALGQHRKPDAIVTIDVDWLGLETAQPLSPKGQGTAMSLRRATEVFQQQMVQSALAQHQHNWSAAARSLGIDTSNLHKLAKRLGLK